MPEYTSVDLYPQDAFFPSSSRRIEYVDGIVAVVGRLNADGVRNKANADSYVQYLLFPQDWTQLAAENYVKEKIGCLQSNSSAWHPFKVNQSDIGTVLIPDTNRPARLVNLRGTVPSVDHITPSSIADSFVELDKNPDIKAGLLRVKSFLANYLADSANDILGRTDMFREFTETVKNDYLLHYLPMVDSWLYLRMSDYSYLDKNSPLKWGSGLLLGDGVSGIPIYSGNNLPPIVLVAWSGLNTLTEAIVHFKFNDRSLSLSVIGIGFKDFAAFGITLERAIIDMRTWNGLESHVQSVSSISLDQLKSLVEYIDFEVPFNHVKFSPSNSGITVKPMIDSAQKAQSLTDNYVELYSNPELVKTLDSYASILGILIDKGPINSLENYAFIPELNSWAFLYPTSYGCEKRSGVLLGDGKSGIPIFSNNMPINLLLGKPLINEPSSDSDNCFFHIAEIVVNAQESIKNPPYEQEKQYFLLRGFDNPLHDGIDFFWYGEMPQIIKTLTLAQLKEEIRYISPDQLLAQRDIVDSLTTRLTDSYVELAANPSIKSNLAQVVKLIGNKWKLETTTIDKAMSFAYSADIDSWIYKASYDKYEIAGNKNHGLVIGQGDGKVPMIRDLTGKLNTVQILASNQFGYPVFIAKFFNTHSFYSKINQEYYKTSVPLVVVFTGFDSLTSALAEMRHWNVDATQLFTIEMYEVSKVSEAFEYIPVNEILSILYALPGTEPQAAANVLTANSFSQRVFGDACGWMKKGQNKAVDAFIDPEFDPASETIPDLAKMWQAYRKLSSAGENIDSVPNLVDFLQFAPLSTFVAITGQAENSFTGIAIGDGDQVPFMDINGRQCPIALEVGSDEVDFGWVAVCADGASPDSQYPVVMVGMQRFAATTTDPLRNVISLDRTPLEAIKSKMKWSPINDFIPWSPSVVTQDPVAAMASPLPTDMATQSADPLATTSASNTDSIDVVGNTDSIDVVSNTDSIDVVGIAGNGDNEPDDDDDSGFFDAQGKKIRDSKKKTKKSQADQIRPRSNSTATLYNPSISVPSDIAYIPPLYDPKLDITLPQIGTPPDTVINTGSPIDANVNNQDPSVQSNPADTSDNGFEVWWQKIRNNSVAAAQLAQVFMAVPTMFGEEVLSVMRQSWPVNTNASALDRAAIEIGQRLKVNGNTITDSALHLPIGAAILSVFYDRAVKPASSATAISDKVDAKLISRADFRLCGVIQALGSRAAIIDATKPLKARVLVTMADTPNLNKRQYSRESLQATIDRIQEKIKIRKFFGYDGHPDEVYNSAGDIVGYNENQNPEVFVITKMWLTDDNVVYADVEFLDTEQGRHYSDRLKNGERVSVSLRAIGDCQAPSDGSNILDCDVTDIGGFDVVDQPALPIAGIVKVIDAKQKSTVKDKNDFLQVPPTDTVQSSLGKPVDHEDLYQLAQLISVDNAPVKDLFFWPGENLWLAVTANEGDSVVGLNGNTVTLNQGNRYGYMIQRNGSGANSVADQMIWMVAPNGQPLPAMIGNTSSSEIYEAIEDSNGLLRTIYMLQYPSIVAAKAAHQAQFPDVQLKSIEPISVASIALMPKADLLTMRSLTNGIEMIGFQNLVSPNMPSIAVTISDKASNAPPHCAGNTCQCGGVCKT